MRDNLTSGLYLLLGEITYTIRETGMSSACITLHVVASLKAFNALISFHLYSLMLTHKTVHSKA